MLYNVNADTDKQQSIFPTTLTVESKKMHKKKTDCKKYKRLDTYI